MNQNECFDPGEDQKRAQQSITGPPSYTPWREIHITKVANGFIINIGCKTFIAKTWLEASTGLAEYWIDPMQAEKKYTEG